MRTSVTLDEVLSDLRANATGERDKGTAFEALTRKFLETAPLYEGEYEKVETFADWAEEGQRKDVGIDLVATRKDGGVVAIQCKFFDPGYTVQKKDIDSFFTASGKTPFTERLIVSTTDKWSSNAEDALDDQQIPATRIGLESMADSGVEWAFFKSLTEAPALRARKRKTLHPYQREAIDDVLLGFAHGDRGKLIMACGTGKTFTSLKFAEETVKPGGSILFLVPSISLLSQSLREWGSEREVPMRFFAVCSDTHVGRTRKQKELNEDISSHDLEIPATTDASKLVAKAATAAGEAITVIFSTYQSIAEVGAAQKAGLPEFDLIICDEAHRTTGVTLTGEGETESAFQRVHSNANIAGKRRLYMTATPRVYGDDAKKKAVEGAAVLASMDNVDLFGPEFHHLSFGRAVDQKLLSDYKVVIFNVAEDYVARALQTVLASDGNEIGLTNAAKLVGCWNALAKRGDIADYGTDTGSMRRAVAFSQTIKASQAVTAAFAELSAVLTAAASDGKRLQVEAEHVDGTQNALYRNERLAWLKAETNDAGTCRILSNARCLSEGVDVPALDAVLFLNPRNSIVDVVQSVGRVMRKSPGKEYGYVIIPVAIPAGMEPHEALDKTDRYKVVWEVLRALRSHDERLEAVIHTLDATKKNPTVFTVNIGGGGSGSDRNDDAPDDAPVQVQGLLDFHDSPIWREAIFARLVKKVGQRMYWDDWAKDVDLIVRANVARINALLDAPGSTALTEFQTFLAGLKGSLNDGIEREHAVNMLAQHLVTRPVFRALFENYDFIEQNAVAKVMEAMLAKLDEHNLEIENAGLEKFYESVRLRLANVDDAGRRQFVEELYGKFFKLAFPKVASQLGIVYTPVEIVDFIIHSVEHILNTEFDASLSDDGVHVLDPFTGTGTFIVRLLESGLIRPEDLLRKYTQELHCNEILLLAYYIAAINIEATFHGIHGGAYVPFTGAVLADTFQMTEDKDVLDTAVFSANNDRMQQQRGLDIRVIFGNPPYSAGQRSQNDGNANLGYPTLDQSIESTYARRSDAGTKRKIYDSYFRAFRWASDRIEGNGVVCFVSNGAFIDSKTADGFRKCVVEEVTALYVFNLRGNQRTAGEESRREGGKVFGEGSRTPVAITLLVKRPGRPKEAVVQYFDVGEYLSREEKLEALSEFGSVSRVGWSRIVPNASGDWLDQRSSGFRTHTAMGAKKTDEPALFATYSLGVVTNRDAWAYNYSTTALLHNMAETISRYNAQLAGFGVLCQGGGATPTAEALERYIDRDESKLSWTANLKMDLLRSRRATFDPNRVVVSSYRPFSKQRLYFDRQWNERVSLMPRLYPTEEHANVHILVGSGTGAEEIVCMAFDHPTDLNISQGQNFPRYAYQENSSGDDLFATGSGERYTRVDNITDEALTDYRAKYGAVVSKDDIFYYVYGLLHSPDYRTAYAADLKRMLPRIPMVASADDFRAFADAGRKLADLHIGYETVEPWPLEISGEPASSMQGDALYDWYRVEKMRFGGKSTDKDRSTVVYNSRITASGIPDEAHEYMLGSRSGVEWVMERYQVKVDKASQIKNDPNDWSREVGDPRYILDLLGRVVRVSVETMRIVAGLPKLQIAVP